jgi:hypothetical protein
MEVRFLELCKLTSEVTQFQKLFFIMLGGGRISQKLRARIKGRYRAFAGQTTTGF